MRRFWLGALALAAVMPEALAAQPPRDPARRGALEQRFRERLASVMRERLGLSDEQLRRLGEANRKFEEQRRGIFREEIEVRRSMRLALREDSAARQDEVAVLLDRALKLERRKLELFEAEQGELSQFLTPVQRAKYVGMQEQLRRQMDEMRERRGVAGPPPPAGRLPRRPPGEGG